MQLAGLVFFAFAFNMVDCGGLLGGRLGNNINMHAASLKKAKVGNLSAQTTVSAITCTLTEPYVKCQRSLSEEFAVASFPSLLFSCRSCRQHCHESRLRPHF